MTARRDRAEPQFFNVYDEGWEVLREAAVLGRAEAKLISRARDSASATYFVRLPPGWRHLGPSADADATLEFFVVEGDLSCGGKTVGAGGFVAVPRGCAAGPLSSGNGAYAVLFRSTVLDPSAYYGDAPRVVPGYWHEPWHASKLPGVQHGVMHKYLRVPDETRDGTGGGPQGILRFAIFTPGFAEARQELHHGNWEEMIFLSGDLLMGERGLSGPGTVLANPADLKHGPLISQRGAIMLYHTDAPVTVVFSPVLGGPDVTEAYLSRTSLSQPGVSQPWAARPEAIIWQSVREGTGENPAHEASSA